MLLVSERTSRLPACLCMFLCTLCVVFYVLPIGVINDDYVTRLKPIRDVDPKGTGRLRAALINIMINGALVYRCSM